MRLPAGSAGRPWPTSAGFTLLELLVVVFIIGVLITVFTLAVGVAGGTEREMLREISRLENLLRLAREDAEFQSRDLGLRFYPDRYEFSGSVFRVVDGTTVREWQPLEDSLFRSRDLPALFRFELDIEGRTVNLERSSQDIARRYQPQLFILSSGDLSDGFAIRLRERAGDLSLTLNVGIDGTTEVTLNGG